MRSLQPVNPSSRMHELEEAVDTCLSINFTVRGNHTWRSADQIRSQLDSMSMFDASQLPLNTEAALDALVERGRAQRITHQEYTEKHTPGSKFNKLDPKFRYYRFEPESLSEPIKSRWETAKEQITNQSKVDLSLDFSFEGLKR